MSNLEKNYRIKLSHIDSSIIIYSSEYRLSYSDIENYFNINFFNFDSSCYTLTWADTDGDWVLLKDDDNLLNEISTQLQEFQRVHFSTKCTRALSGLLSNLSAQTKSYTSTQDSLNSIYRHMLDLSRNLGQMKLQVPKVKNLMIVTKPGDPTLLGLTFKLTEWVVQNFENINVFINEQYIHTKEILSCSAGDEVRVKAWTEELIHQIKFDLCITLGGDGTVLFACSLFQETAPPIIPFHLGSLGFLTVFNFKGFENWLPNILEGGKVPAITRMRFTCAYFESQLDICSSSTVNEQNCTSCKNFGKDGIPTPSKTYQVLNELVVDRGSSAAMIQVELYANNEHWTTILADGLVISTSTGSTAYNLSANGSLAHPAQSSLLITPICPHTLTCRPMILPAWIHLRLCIPEGSRNAGWASFDGRHRIQLKPGNSIVVTASPYPVLTLCKEDLFTDWFDSIDTVLNWNKRILQKPLIDY